jgi:hypothetical protein
MTQALYAHMNNKTINNNNNFLKSLCPELIFNQEDKM